MEVGDWTMGGTSVAVMVLSSDERTDGAPEVDAAAAADANVDARAAMPSLLTVPLLVLPLLTPVPKRSGCDAVGSDGAAVAAAAAAATGAGVVAAAVTAAAAAASASASADASAQALGLQCRR